MLVCISLITFRFSIVLVYCSKVTLKKNSHAIHRNLHINSAVQQPAFRFALFVFSCIPCDPIVIASTLQLLHLQSSFDNTLIYFLCTLVDLFFLCANVKAMLSHSMPMQICRHGHIKRPQAAHL